ncbi:MAG: hypothetical protein PHO08_00730 [Methylococcales bacterium]|nr:hypothetical protein [Methylococcales bacterium]
MDDGSNVFTENLLLLVNLTMCPELLLYLKRSLHNYQHVVGMGVGWKEIQGEVTDTPALRVYVREKVPRIKLHHADVIPSYIDGIRTDVLLERVGSPISAPYTCAGDIPALKASAKVSNLKGVIGKGTNLADGSGIGTLGFIAVPHGSTSGQHLALVSNRHVLLAHGAQKGDLIYQPSYRQHEGRCYFQRDTLNPIAEIADEGFEGNYAYHYPGESIAEYFIDCASAQFLSPGRVMRNPGEKHFKSIGRAHALDTFAGRELRVHKAGQGKQLGVVIGRVVDVMAPVTGSDGKRRENNMVIRADGEDLSFAEEGDSGALIVDHFDRAIGLLWGRSLSRKSEAFACHIHPVIARLNVTPLAYDLAFT